MRDPAESEPGPRGIQARPVAARRARDHVRLLTDDRLDHGSVVAPRHACPHEVVSLGPLRHRDGENAGAKRWRRIGVAGERAQCRTNEEQGADEGGDRISREPEDERSTPAPEREGLAGPHRDAPEHLLDPEALLDASDEVVRANRHATRRHDDIRRESLFERCLVRLFRILGRGEARHHGAGGLEQRREHDSVRLVDLPGRERLTRRAKLGSRDDDRHAWRPVDDDPVDPARRKSTDPGRCQRLSRGEKGRAEPRVASRLANVVPRRDGFRDRDAISLEHHTLDRDDGIRAVRHDRAGRDLDRLSRLEPDRRRAAGCRLPDDRQRAGSVGRADGIPVHRRAPKRRYVDRSDNRPGADPTRGRCEGHLFHGKHLDAREDAGEGFVDREEVVHGSHATPGRRGTLAS